MSAGTCTPSTRSLEGVQVPAVIFDNLAPDQVVELFVTINAKHTKLMDLGLQPHLLSETLIESMFDQMERYKHRVIADRIDPRTRWRGVLRDKASR